MPHAFDYLMIFIFFFFSYAMIRYLSPHFDAYATYYAFH